MLVTRIRIIIKQNNLFKSIANIFTEVFDKTKDILYSILEQKKQNNQNICAICL